MRKLLSVLLILTFLAGLRGLAGAQTAAVPAGAPPSGFRGISLGMRPEAVKAALRADPLFRYRGDPDVSLVPQEAGQSLIECEGAMFVRRAYFQFEKERLFIIILVLDPQAVDHYSVYTTLTRKYGEPSSLSPQESVWLFDAVRLSLERPLAVKYVERAIFASVQKGAAPTDLEQISRDRFLEQF
jgi:hypothetical protein